MTKFHWVLKGVLGFCSLVVMGMVSAHESSFYKLESLSVPYDKKLSIEWNGEPIFNSIRAYGVESVTADVIFVKSDQLNSLAERYGGISPLANVYAIHLYGVGSQNSEITSILGVSVIEEKAEALVMKTYMKQGEGFIENEHYSGGVIGALDCDSVSNMGILLAKENSHVKVLTVGREHYKTPTISDSRYSKNLAMRAIELAISRTEDYSSLFSK